MNSLTLHAGIVLYYAIAWILLLQCLFALEIKDERLNTMLSITDRYLTGWNVASQTIIFFAYLVYDILEVRQICTYSFRAKLKLYLDKYFYSIIVGKTTLVFILFWSFYSIDPGYVFRYPTVVPDVLPPWANHILHTNIFPLAVLHVYHNKATPIKFSDSQRNAFIMTVLYITCVYGTYFQKNVWVYPFLDNLGEPLRTFVIFIAVLITFAIHFVFFHLNKWYCSTGAEKKIRTD